MLSKVWLSNMFEHFLYTIKRQIRRFRWIRPQNLPIFWGWTYVFLFWQRFNLFEVVGDICDCWNWLKTESQIFTCLFFFEINRSQQPKNKASLWVVGNCEMWWFQFCIFFEVERKDEGLASIMEWSPPNRSLISLSIFFHWYVYNYFNWFFW